MHTLPDSQTQFNEFFRNVFQIDHQRLRRGLVVAEVALAITLLAGDHQTGQVGSPLPHDIVLGVDDQYGNPVPHVAVLARPRDGSVPDTVVETWTRLGKLVAQG